MRRILSFIQSTSTEILILGLLIAVYFCSAKISTVLSRTEQSLLESVSESISNNNLFYPFYTLDGTIYTPASPLLAELITILFQFFPATLLTVKVFVLIISFSALFIFHNMAARLFNSSAAMLSSGFMVASWGFFSNSYAINGAMLYFILILIIFLTFFHWFDAAFRSRTYAKSLYIHFAIIGFSLGLTFCSNGIVGILFPTVVMLTTVIVSNRLELLKDIHYSWILTPFAAIALLCTTLGSVSIGFFPFLKTLFSINPNYSHLYEPLLYMVPIVLLLFPGILSKDIWNRAFITYLKSLFLMGSWLIWALIFLFLFPSFHEAFSLLVIAPAMIWLGFYLGEIFRNPLFPLSLQVAVDVMVLSGLVASVCSIILTFQIVPPSLFPGFIILSSALALISIIMLIVRDLTISRALPFYIIPFSLLFCILAKTTVEPLLLFHPSQELIPIVSKERSETERSSILEWVENKKQISSIIEFTSSFKGRIIPISNQTELESMIQTRQGPVYLILPEEQFYSLPYSVRESGYLMARSWQWQKPLTVSIMLEALYDEMLDFKTLSKPVILFRIPTAEDT